MEHGPLRATSRRRPTNQPTQRFVGDKDGVASAPIAPSRPPQHHLVIRLYTQNYAETLNRFSIFFSHQFGTCGFSWVRTDRLHVGTPPRCALCSRVCRLRRPLLCCLLGQSPNDKHRRNETPVLASSTVVIVIGTTMANKWECEKCLFDNEATISFCQLCGHHASVELLRIHVDVKEAEIAELIRVRDGYSPDEKEVCLCAVAVPHSVVWLCALHGCLLWLPAWLVAWLLRDQRGGR